MKKIAIIGTSGFAKEAFEFFSQSPRHDVAGFISNDSTLSEFLSLPILCSDEKIESLKDLDINHLFIAIGDIKTRSRLYSTFTKMGFELASLIHPTSFVSSYAKIGKGTIVYPNCVINTECVIGDGTIINSGTTIGHETKINNFCNINPGVNIAGNVTISNNSFIGIGASIIENINIGENSIVGGGSLVIKNVAANKTVVGVPAKDL